MLTVPRWSATVPLAALLALPGAAHAQWPFVSPAPGAEISVEFVHPGYTGIIGEVTGFTTGQALLGVAFPLGRQMRLVAELPASHVDADGYDGVATSVGNPYVGIEIGGGGVMGGRIGVRAPLASSDFGHSGAQELAIFGDYTRFEAYVPRLVTVGGVMQATYRQPSGLMAGALAGSDLMVSTEGGDPELVGTYGLRAGYERRSSSATVALIGRVLLTEGDLDNTAVDQVTFAASHAFGRFRPGVSVRVPLDVDLSEVMDYAVGVSLRVGL